MDDEVIWILIVLAAIGALLVGSILGFVANGRSRRLARTVERLEERISALESGWSHRPRSALEDLEASLGVTSAEPDRPSAGVAAPLPEPTVPPPAISEVLADRGEAAVGSGGEAAQAGAGEPPTGHDGPATEAAAMAAVEEPAPRRRRDLEEALGTRWAVWVGGVALALGGIFLVRYSIEAGLIGPGMRIIAGLVFAAALLGAGERLRRSRGASYPGADIPSILTAAGTVAAFATVYAAYVLYGFLGDTAAFLALALVAFATLVLALLHGPGLAALGLVASYATPLLVSTDQPSFGALSAYLVAVTIATLAVAGLKGWRWLAIAAVVGSVLWGLFMMAISGSAPTDVAVIAVYLVLAYALAHLTFVTVIHADDPGRVDPANDGVAVAVLSLFALTVLFHLGVFGVGAFGILLLVGYGAAAMTTAYNVNAMRLLVVAGIVVVLVGYMRFAVPYETVVDPVTGAVVTPDLPTLLATAPAARLIGSGLVLGLFFGALGLFGVLGSASRAMLAVAGAVIPLGLLVLAYLVISEFRVSVPFGFAALALAFYFGAATEGFARRLPAGEHGVDGAIAAYAVAAIAALAAGLAMMFERGVLTIALSAIVPALAMVEVSRPVKALRPIAVAVAILVALRFWYEPEVVGSDLGTTPIFNWLLWGYGVPALCFALAAWRFGKTRDDRYVHVVEGFAVTFTALTVVMLIHHAMTGGNVFAPVSGLVEQSLLATSLMTIALGLQWLSVRRPSPVFGKGTLLVGALGLILAGLGLLIAQNPFFSGEPITGGAFDWRLALGYLPPAVMALLIARTAARRVDKPDWYVALASALGGLLALAWVTLAVRASWHVGDLGWSLFGSGGIEEGEMYAYSAAWLVCGVILLVLGVVTKKRVLRSVAAALVIAVVVKVFLFDTAALTGALRAASFIVLGAVLVVVGLGYQRFMRRAVGP